MKTYKFLIIVFFFIPVIVMPQKLSLSNSGSGINPLTGIIGNGINCFEGSNLYFHSAAILSTIVFSQAGTDYQVYDYFSRNRSLEGFAGPAAVAGYIIPAALSGGMYLYGIASKDYELAAAGSAAGQSVIIAVVYSSLLKAVTGRPGPGTETGSSLDESKTFRFGFLRGGIHYGWPSGHLITSTALVTSLMTFYKGNLFVNVLGSMYLGYMTIGVIAHEGSTMHWFSDVIAGAILGAAIGITTGNNFHNLYYHDGVNQTASDVKLFPQVSHDYFGINLNISL